MDCPKCLSGRDALHNVYVLSDMTLQLCSECLSELVNVLSPKMQYYDELSEATTLDRAALMGGGKSIFGVRPSSLAEAKDAVRIAAADWLVGSSTKKGTDS